MERGRDQVKWDPRALLSVYIKLGLWSSIIIYYLVDPACSRMKSYFCLDDSIDWNQDTNSISHEDLSCYLMWPYRLCHCKILREMVVVISRWVFVMCWNNDSGGNEIKRHDRYTDVNGAVNTDTLSLSFFSPFIYIYIYLNTEAWLI